MHRAAHFCQAAQYHELYYELSLLRISNAIASLSRTRHMWLITLRGALHHAALSPSQNVSHEHSHEL